MKQRQIKPIYANTYQQLRHQYHRRRAWLIVLVLLVLIGGWLTWRHYRQAQLDRYPIRGVAIDQENGFVDFQLVEQAHQQFVYLHTSSGATYTDDQFKNSYNRALGSSLSIGVYHVYSFSTSPKAQLANFTQEVGHKIGNLPIAVQVDFYDQYNAHRLATPKSRHRLSEFVHLVQQRYHRRVIVWSPDQVWQTLKSAAIAKQPRWAVSNGARKLSQQVLFNEFDSDWSLKLGQQKQTVPAIYFNGSRHEWNQRYVR